MEWQQRRDFGSDAVKLGITWPDGGGEAGQMRVNHPWVHESAGGGYGTADKFNKTVVCSEVRSIQK